MFRNIQDYSKKTCRGRVEGVSGACHGRVGMSGACRDKIFKPRQKTSVSQIFTRKRFSFYISAENTEKTFEIHRTALRCLFSTVWTCFRQKRRAFLGPEHFQVHAADPVWPVQGHAPKVLKDKSPKVGNWVAAPQRVRPYWQTTRWADQNHRQVQFASLLGGGTTKNKTRAKAK